MPNIPSKQLLVSEANKEQVITEFYEHWIEECKKEGITPNELQMLEEGMKQVTRNIVEKKIKDGTK